MKNLALIPLRSESKRVKHKNIKLIANHPLFYYQIQCAIKIKSISKVVVVTDDNYYKELAGLYDVDVIDRPKKISGPESKTEEVMLYTLNLLENKGEFYDNIILLQATNPLNKPDWIEEGLDKLEKDSNVMSIITYCNLDRFLIEDVNLLKERPRTQDFTGLKIETGLFWITRVNALKKAKNRVVSPFKTVEVSKLAGMLDIDNPEDINIAETLIKPQVMQDENLYFKKREFNVNYENYWGPKPDPDGNIRDLSKEDIHKLEFCKNEIKFINNIKNKKGKKILDLGCGVGTISKAFDNKYKKYGLETSEYAAKKASKYLDYIHIGELSINTYEEEFFDLVFCSHVIEHVVDPIEFIKNINYITRTHGHLIISTPNFDSAAARKFGEKFRLLHDKTHISLCSDSTLKDLLDHNGFICDYIDYPFFDTKYFTMENFKRMFNTNDISPPFYGSVMTLYCRKK